MKLKTIFLALALFAALTITSQNAVRAEPSGVTFVVNSTLDEIDMIGADGQCISSPSQVCTLRAAIMAANALPGKDTIELAAQTYKLTRPVGDDANANSDDLDITEDVIIKGKGATSTTIDAQSKYRVFDLLPNTNVEISGLRIYRGNSNPEVGGGHREMSSSLRQPQMNMTIPAAAQDVLSARQSPPLMKTPHSAAVPKAVARIPFNLVMAITKLPVAHSTTRTKQKILTFEILSSFKAWALPTA